MTDSATPPVRVPNVSPGAKSGLDHTVIGANAQEAYDANETLAAEGTEGHDSGPDTEEIVPAGTLEERLTWVSEGDTSEEKTRRADVIWQHETEADPEADKAALSEQLRNAVYGNGETVDSDTADTGEAVNADTGEVTAPGDDLPEITEPVTVPEDLTTVDELLDWVKAPEDDDEKVLRAEAVLTAEREQEHPRTTLVTPLENLLEAYDASQDSPE